MNAVLWLFNCDVIQKDPQNHDYYFQRRLIVVTKMKAMLM